MILFWGVPADKPLAAVWHALHRRGAKLAFFDQHRVLETTMELVVDAAVGGFLQVGDQRLDLERVTGLYLRPFEWRQLPAVEAAGPSSPAWQHALDLQETLTTWAEITPAQVVNRPTPMASNASKPFQVPAIRAAGFATPETLITTDPAAALAFWEEHGDVIYKSVSGVRSIVSRLGAEHRARLADVTWCPTQFQAYVPGDDVRVHVVGDEVFASEVRSSADDYRYAAAGAEIAAIELPAGIAAMCRQLTVSLELSVAGIDLRRTPDDTWYCFEVNTSPGFTYFQDATGQLIDEAIARLLLAGAAVES